jgi:hypothetical protein
MPTREIRIRYTALDDNVEHEVAILRILCEMLVRMNVLEIRGDPAFFENDLDGVRYIPPPSCRSVKGVRGCQPVKGIARLITSRQGTCIDIASAFCSLLREKYGDGEAAVDVTTNNEGTFHTTVHTSTGRVFDPEAGGWIS